MLWYLYAYGCFCFGLYVCFEPKADWNIYERILITVLRASLWPILIGAKLVQIVMEA
jgi:hypothetical protein